MLRVMRFDERPQLLNVLFGEAFPRARAITASLFFAGLLGL
jgi:hypothetical protein